MRTSLAASGTCLLLVGTALAAVAAPAAAATEPSVTVHHVAPVLLYRLVERFDDGDQDDEGSVRVTYSCHPGEAGITEVFAMAVTSNGFLPPTFGEVVPCDDRRHTVRLGVFRKVTTPFTPPGRFEDADLSLSFNLGPGEADVGAGLTVPVRIRYVGF